MITPGKRTADRIALALFVASVLLGAALFTGLRMAFVTDYFYSRLDKDPERTPPPGKNIVSPADGTVLYVRKFTGGQVPLVIKNRIPIPVNEFLHIQRRKAPPSGFLIGIYMNTFGVHMNRVPLNATVRSRHWYNGPHMEMTRLERRLILGALIPGSVFFKKVLGLAPYQICSEVDYITKSARETLIFEGDYRCYVVRIADFYVGRILTWVSPGDSVKKGQRFGFIGWGSQTDLLIETGDPLSLNIRVKAGDYVYGGKTIIASY